MAGGSVLHSAVTDAGPGISAKFRRQAGGTDRPNMGLGLDGRTRIIPAHGGTIWCDAGVHGVGMRLAHTLPGEGSSRIHTGCVPACRRRLQRLSQVSTMGETLCEASEESMTVAVRESREGVASMEMVRSL
jgi:hypothetical protein